MITFDMEGYGLNNIIGWGSVLGKRKDRNE
jgi:hypothetical protein